MDRNQDQGKNEPTVKLDEEDLSLLRNLIAEAVEHDADGDLAAGLESLVNHLPSGTVTAADLESLDDASQEIENALWTGAQTHLKGIIRHLQADGAAPGLAIELAKAEGLIAAALEADQYLDGFGDKIAAGEPIGRTCLFLYSALNQCRQFLEEAGVEFDEALVEEQPEEDDDDDDDDNPYELESSRNWRGSSSQYAPEFEPGADADLDEGESGVTEWNPGLSQIEQMLYLLRHRALEPIHGEVLDTNRDEISVALIMAAQERVAKSFEQGRANIPAQVFEGMETVHKMLECYLEYIDGRFTLIDQIEE